MGLEASLAYHIYRNTQLSPVLNLINPVHILCHIDLEPTLILSSHPHQDLLIGLFLLVLAPQLYIHCCTPTNHPHHSNNIYLRLLLYCSVCSLCILLRTLSHAPSVYTRLLLP